MKIQVLDALAIVGILLLIIGLQSAPKNFKTAETKAIKISSIQL